MRKTWLNELQLKTWAGLISDGLEFVVMRRNRHSKLANKVIRNICNKNQKQMKGYGMRNSISFLSLNTSSLSI